jgi:hypothetical protein
MEVKVQKSYVPAPTLSEINSNLDQSDWSTRKQCPACRASAIEPFVEVRYFKYDRCTECGFVFANPAPSDRTIEQYLSFTTAIFTATTAYSKKMTLPHGLNPV